MYTGHPDQHFGHITYSQHGEDLMVANLFKLMRIDKPSYLDIGAHHPIHISNTALLYSRGSRGVNIEANPMLMGAFDEHRPEDRNVCVAVGLSEEMADLHLYDETSGLNSLLGSEIPGGPKGSIRVVVVPLGWVIDTICGGIWPDFLSIDVEGMDFEILSGHHFLGSNKPKIICAEVRPHQSAEWDEMMRWKGFRPICRMGENMIFIERSRHVWPL